MSFPFHRALRHGLVLGVAVLALVVAPRVVPAAESVTLEQVLAEVVAGDPALVAQRHEIDAARARARRAGAFEAPMLDLMVENVPVGGGFDMDPMTMRVIGLEQRVVVSGARGLARRAARAEVHAQEAMADDTRWQRLSLAWQAYADAYWADERLAAARGHRALMDRMASAARARYESGRGRLENLLRVEAERARIEADAVGFEAEVSGARARLAELMGRGGDGADLVLVEPRTVVAPDSAAGWAEVVASHPRVRMNLERGRARNDEAAAMRRMVWPDLTLRASYGYRSDLHHGGPQDDMWSAGVGLMLPIGTGARQGADAAAMTAMAEAARSEARAQSLAIERELRTLRAEARAAERTATLLQDTVAVADRRVLAAAWSSYETARTDLAGVFDAAHALYAEEIEVTRARQAQARASARLLAITARGDLVGVRIATADAPKEGVQR
ncbi:MAG: hypothetical protein RL760_795 [Candidatus Eisenbacteria bacterium]